MTCIVAVSDGEDVWMGGDSAGIDGFDLVLREDAKVFCRPPFVMGFTSSFRMGQLLQYALLVRAQPAGMPDHEYMSTRFVDDVRACLKDGGYARKTDEAEAGGTFIVGYKGQIFVIADDYQVGLNRADFAACGCGYQIAHGSLCETGRLPPEQRVLRALAAAERFSGGVRGPFSVVATGGPRACTPMAAE